MPTVRDRLGAGVVHDLFGTNLEQQGRGYYVALELFAMIRGSLEIDASKVLPPLTETVEYQRRSHDFARRLATRAPIPPDAVSAAMQGATTQDTLEALLSSLTVEVPGRRRAPKWFAAHLYPFIGELVHYDAVERRGNPSIERYSFRDGGGLAHFMLRTDDDTARLERNRLGLIAVVSDSDTALGQVAAALTHHDFAQATDTFTDYSEGTSISHDDLSDWPELLRAGVDRITRRPGVPRAKRVEQLMHWIPYCIARHQLRLALLALDKGDHFIPLDFHREPNELRTRSQQALDEFRWSIVDALVSEARRRREAASEEDKPRWDRHTQNNPGFVNSPRAFFTETLAAVGALNATTGRRHFTMKIPLLEAVLAATIDPGTELPFDLYCAQWSREMSIVADQNSAREAGLTRDIDEGVMADNAAGLRARLASAGLLTHYSDATSLVHGEAR